MKIGLNGKVYPLSDVTEATLAELLILERQTAELGRALNLGELEGMGRTVAGIACDAHKVKADPRCTACGELRGRHPDSLWLLGASVWLARRRAGERVTFEEALDFDVLAVEWIPEPGDVVADAAEPDPTGARPGSGPGVKRAAAVAGKAKASKS